MAEMLALDKRSGRSTFTLTKDAEFIDQILQLAKVLEVDDWYFPCWFDSYKEKKGPLNETDVRFVAGDKDLAIEVVIGFESIFVIMTGEKLHAANQKMVEIFPFRNPQK